MDLSAMFRLSYGLYVVGVQGEKGNAGCIVDAFMQTTVDPCGAMLSNNRANETNRIIKEKKRFSISVLSTDVDPFVIANFGFQSSREVSKWDNVPHSMMDGLPILDGACAYLICEMVDVSELSTHSLFTCNVLDAVVGVGEPLVYGEYQKTMKPATMAAFKAFKEGHTVNAIQDEGIMVCSVCGYEHIGVKSFEALPADWKCPICKQGKSVFNKK